MACDHHLRCELTPGCVELVDFVELVLDTDVDFHILLIVNGYFMLEANDWGCALPPRPCVHPSCCTLDHGGAAADAMRLATVLLPLCVWVPASVWLGLGSYY